jgi:hypothetical protein
VDNVDVLLDPWQQWPDHRQLDPEREPHDDEGRETAQPG